MELTKEIIDKIEKETSCSVQERESYYEISVDNTCGEDFTFEINKGDDEIKEIISYCDDFDPGEHFKLWYGQNNGEPSDPQELLDNCKEIKESLMKLSNLLESQDAMRC